MFKTSASPPPPFAPDRPACSHAAPGPQDLTLGTPAASARPIAKTAQFDELAYYCRWVTGSTTTVGNWMTVLPVLTEPRTGGGPDPKGPPPILSRSPRSRKSLSVCKRWVIPRSDTEAGPMSYTYDFPRPSVTTDIVVFSIRDGVLQVLLIERKLEPLQKGAWAIPAGSSRWTGSARRPPLRELEEETGLARIPIRQLARLWRARTRPEGAGDHHRLHRAGAVGRPDPARGGSDAQDAKWFPVEAPSRRSPSITRRSSRMRRASWQRRSTASTHDSALVAFHFLPSKFTLSQASGRSSKPYAARDYGQAQFRKWLTNEWSIEDTSEKNPRAGAIRPAAVVSPQAGLSGAEPSARQVTRGGPKNEQTSVKK